MAQKEQRATKNSKKEKGAFKKGKVKTQTEYQSTRVTKKKRKRARVADDKQHPPLHEPSFNFLANKRLFFYTKNTADCGV